MNRTLWMETPLIVRLRYKRLVLILVLALACLLAGCSNDVRDSKTKTKHVIVTSDTILSGMVASLLPSDRYNVEAILPPGQCPGHYDVKLSDMEKVKNAELIVSFKDMPFMQSVSASDKEFLRLDTEGRNWMAPDSYLYGLNKLAEHLSQRYPDEKNRIMGRKNELTEQVKSTRDSLGEKIGRAGIVGKAVIASSLQKEPLEWMGFRVVGEYGRPEAISAKEIVQFAKVGRRHRVALVVDNLQSGPDAGRGVAEALGIPHVVLSNFPSENGYLATLKQNVHSVIAAAGRK
jgi:zinc transport system substrate-binding protein